MCEYVHSYTNLLLVAKYEIDPFVQARRDIVRLKGLAVDSDELVWIAFGPGRQDDVIQNLYTR